MQFLTIGQYFYKLYNAILLILLIPIIAFIMVYFQVFAAEISPKQSFELLIGLPSIVALNWIVMFILYNKKVASIRRALGLRAKLEKYYYLTIVRYLLIALGCLVLAFGFQVTKEDVFTGLFILNLILAAVLWPLSSKVSNDLKLRGDEREMVYYKKDTL